MKLVVHNNNNNNTNFAQSQPVYVCTKVSLLKIFSPTSFGKKYFSGDSSISDASLFQVDYFLRQITS